MPQLLQNLRRPQLLAAGAVAALVLGAFAWLILGQGQPTDRVLWGGLEPAAVAPISQVLDTAGIAYRIGPGGGSIMVAEDDLGRARMLVAAQGLPQAGPAGYELMDRGQTLGSTQFRDEITYLRSVEGELARSIGTLSGVRAAKVHIVMAKREPFSREWTPPTASVLLTVNATGLVGREEVSAIRHLVAAAVPRLKVDDVSVVDNLGNLLARVDRGTDAELDRNEQRRILLEERLARAIEEQLTPIVGAGRVRAKVVADLDFSSSRTVEESFDSLGQVPRSSQNETEQEKSNETKPNVSVDRTLPENADRNNAQPGVQSERQRNKETINYEIGRTTREQVSGAGELRRLSISIAVDGICSIDPDGRTVCTARPPEDLAHLERLARATAGFSAERGDTFEIASVPFAALEPIVTNEPVADPSLAESSLFWPLVIGASVLVLAGLAGFIWYRRRLNRLKAEAAAELARLEAEALAAEAAEAALPKAEANKLLTDAQSDADATVDLGRNIQGGVKRATIHRLQQMIDNDIEDAVMFLRAWLNEKRDAR